VLHQVVAEHLEPFPGAVAAAGDGAGLPQFVEHEFREFLRCGVYEAGVARFQCKGCAREHLVPFSCKGRGFCPSCGGRRMTERAAHLLRRGGARYRARDVLMPRFSSESVGFHLHCEAVSFKIHSQTLAPHAAPPLEPQAQPRP
jgi:hypothetical protein